MSRRTYRAWAFVCLLLSCAGASAATTAATATAEPMRYVRPQAEGVVDRRLDYYWDLLRAALDVTRSRYGPYELRSHPVLMNAERAAFMLDADQGVTVIARTTSREREKKHLPIRIPLDKGLTGYRLFLIPRSGGQRAHTCGSGTLQHRPGQQLGRCRDFAQRRADGRNGHGLRCLVSNAQRRAFRSFFTRRQ